MQQISLNKNRAGKKSMRRISSPWFMEIGSLLLLRIWQEEVPLFRKI